MTTKLCDDSGRKLCGVTSPITRFLPSTGQKKKEQKIFLTTIEIIPPPAAVAAAFTAFPRRRQLPPADAVVSTRSP